MKRVKYIFKLIFLMYVAYKLGFENMLSFEEVIILISLIGINIFKEKYIDTSYLIFTSLFIIMLGINFNNNFGILLALAAFDFICKANYAGVLIVLAFEIYLLNNTQYFIMVLMITCISSLFAYVLRMWELKEKNYRKLLDEERGLRYELEQYKMRLLNSSKETAHLAEVRERNRIAREIHDSIGHSTTAILIQLQAAYKLFERDDKKAKSIVNICIHALSDTVTLLRDTVHNIKPVEKLGVEYIQNIIKDFSFCPVNFKFTGDFNSLSTNNLEITAANIKEALTNAARHSRATEIQISIDINELYTRLYIEDNGVGCSNIKEGLGITGMRERIQNIGGNISVSSDGGFIIVCIIPGAREDNIGENFNCR